MGHIQTQCRDVEECDSEPPSEPPRPSRGRPRKTGLQPKREQRRRQDDSDDHLRQPTTGPDVIEQDMVIDTEASKVSDDRPDQGVLRMDQEEGITADEQARRRLRSKQPARRSLTDDETVSKRLKREATIAAIKQEILKTVPERPDLKQAQKFYASTGQ